MVEKYYDYYVKSKNLKFDFNFVSCLNWLLMKLEKINENLRAGRKKPLVLKLDSHLLKKIIFICFNESPLIMMKNPFFSSYIVLTFWSCRRNGLIRKIRFISKFITSQPG